MHERVLLAVPSLGRRIPTRALAVTAIAVVGVTAAVALGACGGAQPAPAPTPTPPDAEQDGGGRAIGAEQGPDQEATGASVAFVRGYLAWQRGELADVDEIPNASADLAEAIRRERIPPAQRERDSAIAAARVERLDAQSARVTVTVVNRDEDLTYPVPVDLQRTSDGRWIVLSAGTDL